MHFCSHASSGQESTSGKSDFFQQGFRHFAPEWNLPQSFRIPFSFPLSMHVLRSDELLDRAQQMKLIPIDFRKKFEERFKHLQESSILPITNIIRLNRTKFLGSKNSEELCTLIVKEGDCLSEIAKVVGVPVNELMHINRIKDAECLQIGQSLLIPRAVQSTESKRKRLFFWKKDGKNVRLRAIANSGDTLWSLADAYSVTVDDLCKVNGFPEGYSHLDIGQEILIPFKPFRHNLAAISASLPSALRQSISTIDPLPLHFHLRKEHLKSLPIIGSSKILDYLPYWKPESFALPVQGGWLTSYYGWKDGRWYFHNGIDIAVEEGSKIVTSTSGRVSFSDWNGGYGKTVCVDHGNGLETLYAHCSQLLVKEGDFVRKGKVIALSGNTGYSTGPHLHFEIRKGGETVDPLIHLPHVPRFPS